MTDVFVTYVNNHMESREGVTFKLLSYCVITVVRLLVYTEMHSRVKNLNIKADLLQ